MVSGAGVLSGGFHPGNKSANPKTPNPKLYTTNLNLQILNPNYSKLYETSANPKPETLHPTPPTSPLNLNPPNVEGTRLRLGPPDS